MAEIKSRLNGYRSFRNTEKSLGNGPIHPGDQVQVVSIEIAVANLKPEEMEGMLNLEVVAEGEADGEVLQARKAVRELLERRDARTSTA
jgi:hypothetical protein